MAIFKKKQMRISLSTLLTDVDRHGEENNGTLPMRVDADLTLALVGIR